MTRVTSPSALRLALAAAVLTGLAGLGACGGGGGSSGDSGGGGGTGPLAITVDNGFAVARAGVTAATAGQLAATANAGLIGPSGAQFAINQARRARDLAVPSLASGRRYPAGVQTFPCSRSGTISFNLIDLNNDQQFDASGESLTLTAVQCDEGTGLKIDGAFTLALTAYTDANNFALNLVFANFSAVDQTAATTFAVNGSLVVALSNGNEISVHSDIFSASSKAGGGATHSFSAQNYTASVLDGGTQLTESVAGTFSSSDYGGQSVTISTPVALVILTDDSYPSQGTMVIAGASGSAAKLEALNAAQVRVSVDANGDGNYEVSSTVNWPEID